MSIVNLWLEEDRALLAVDTVGIEQTTGQRLECTKLSVLPHAQSVLAGAGTVGAIHVIAASLLHSAAVVDFDSAAEVLAATVNAQFQALLQHMPVLAESPQQEIVLAGYSSRLDRMAAVSFKQHTLEQGFEQSDVEHAYVLPWAPEMGEPPAFGTEDQMEAVMHAQMAFTKTHAPQHVCGGHMISAEITRDGISLRRRPLVSSTQGTPNFWGDGCFWSRPEAADFWGGAQPHPLA